MKQIRPDYNLNGSGRRNLYANKVDEKEALQKAIEIFSMYFPHGRDYQMPGFCLKEAQEEQQKRIDVLQEMLSLVNKELEGASG